MSRIRPLNEGDLDALLALRMVSFPGVDLEPSEYRRLLARRLPHAVGLFIGDDLACAAAIYPSRMFLAGVSVKMGALAGVASAPEYRRRGLVRELLRHALEELRGAGVGWCLEYPFDPRFYHRLGWQSLPSGIELELPIELLYAGKPPPARRLALEEFATLAPLYRAWASRYSFSLDRTDDPREPWKRIVSEQWLDHDGFLYRLEGAYLLFSLSRLGDDPLLTVEDYAYDDPSGRRDLLAFVGSMQGQVSLVRIQLPADDPLTLDGGLRHIRSKRWPLQARVVDLSAALAPLIAAGEQSFRLRVRDRLCPWNDGTFELTSGPAGTEVAATGGHPDAELPIQSVALLLSGAVSPAGAIAHGQASGRLEALAALAALGGGRTPFLPLSDAF